MLITIRHSFFDLENCQRPKEGLKGFREIQFRPRGSQVLCPDAHAACLVPRAARGRRGAQDLGNFRSSRDTLLYESI